MGERRIACLFNAARIDDLPPAAIVARGLIQLPQNRELFPNLTVLSNLKPGASLGKDKEGISVLLVTQDTSLTLAVAQRGYALRVGKIVLEGDIDSIKTSDAAR